MVIWVWNHSSVVHEAAPQLKIKKKNETTLGWCRRYWDMDRLLIQLYKPFWLKSVTSELSNWISFLDFIKYYPIIVFNITWRMNRVPDLHCVPQFLEQKYGYYHCRECNLRWESAYVWCVQGTNKVSFLFFLLPLLLCKANWIGSISPYFMWSLDSWVKSCQPSLVFLNCIALVAKIYAL